MPRGPKPSLMQPSEALRKASVSAQASHTIPLEHPPFRSLHVLAFDPSVSIELENAVINRLTMKVIWEPELMPGPVGEYLEVVDVDPPSNCAYAPVDLNSVFLLADEGLDPSEANPQFHQQMVYAVIMTTIRNFERALGRSAFWATRPWKPGEERGGRKPDRYVQRLRVYPHALREANAYYSSDKIALLFGYFPAPTSDPRYYPGGMVFTCLSHDIVAHETTHALLDGMHVRFHEASNPDVLAFHEAFADIVALFQHFTFPEVLRHQIAKTRGNLATENLLLDLAHQFGQATEAHGALRSALGEYDENKVWKPQPIDPEAMEREREPHARGALLVAAVFDAFIAIYQSRTADLLRIATGGTGIPAPGSMHPDLVNRLALEAAKAAQHVLTMCIRALDYMAPVDPTFGEFLRALITADCDLVPDDDLGYRVAFIEAFRRRGIYPRDVRTLSIESLRWSQPKKLGLPCLLPIVSQINKMMPEWTVADRNKNIFDNLEKCRINLHQGLKPTDGNTNGRVLRTLLDLDPKRPFEVHSIRPAHRVGPDGDVLNDLVIEIAQSRPGYFDEAIQKQVDDGWKGPGKPPRDFTFRGGCTLLVDPKTGDVRYCIYKHIDSKNRLERQRAFLADQMDASLRALYFGEQQPVEPFALLHRSAAGAKEAMKWPQ